MSYVLPGKLAVITAANANRLTVLGHLPHRWGVGGIAFSPDGVQVATVHETLRVWRVWDGELEATMQGGEGVMFSAAFRPDGALLAVAASDGVVRLWSARHGVQMGILRSHRAALHSVAFSPDSTLIAAGSGDFAGEPPGGNVVHVWDARTNWGCTTLEEPTAGAYVAFNPAQPLLAAGDANGCLWVWQVGTWERVRTFAMPGESGSGVSALVFSPDGSLLVAGGCRFGAGDELAGLIGAWNVVTGEPVGVLEAGGQLVTSLSFTPNGSLLASGSSDAGNSPGTVRLWDVRRGQLAATLAGHTRPVQAVAISPDGTLLASGGGDGVRLWGVRA